MGRFLLPPLREHVCTLFLTRVKKTTAVMDLAVEPRGWWEAGSEESGSVVVEGKAAVQSMVGPAYS